MSKTALLKKLYLVVFLTGAIVMILEMIGSRILAPSLGTSTYVWASIIGVILGAMSLGYYYGGKIADIDPNWQTFSRIIFASGFCVFLIIIFKQNILDLSTFFGIKSGSVFASTLLFAVPSFLLGMVSPYAVRLAMENVETSGRTVGNLYAVSTFGSIVGTFAAGFVLIPHFGNVNILFGLAFALFAIGFFCYSGKGQEKAMITAVALVCCGYAVVAEAGNGGRYVYEQDSEYNHIRVFETEKAGRPIRVMSVENIFDSGIYLDSDELVFEYTKYYALDEAFGGKIGKAAMFGGAAYSVPKDFLKRNSEGTIDVVEIDPLTTEVAKRYFGLREDPRMNIIHDDARIFLNENAESGKGEYDAIYNDAFSSACSMAPHLATVEAIGKAYDLLDDDGVYIANIISSLEGEKSTFFRAEYKTISEKFEGVYVFATQPSSYDRRQTQNIMIVATKHEKDIDSIKAGLQSASAYGEKIAPLLANYRDERIETGDVVILTDDFSPVSYYAAAVCMTR